MFEPGQKTIAIVTVGLAPAGLVVTGDNTIRAKSRADREALRAEARADRSAWQASMDAFREKADADREAFRGEVQRLGERQARVEGALTTAAAGQP